MGKLLDLDVLKRMVPKSAQIVARVATRLTVCPVCHQPMLGHVRCKDCGILVGPEHYEPEVDGRGRCWDCAEWRKRKRR